MPARIRQCDIDGLKSVENELVRICYWLDVRDVKIFFGPKLFKRSGNSRIHVVPGLPIRPRVWESRRRINSQNTASLSLIALRRSIHPMASFDPPSSISKFIYIIRRVDLNTQDVGDDGDLIHSEVNNRHRLPHIRLGLT